MDRARRARVNRPWWACAQTALVSGLCWGAGSAVALGVGSPSVHSYLGQPLHLEFPLELSRGESVSLECLKLEAFAGDVRLPPSQLKVQLFGRSETTVRALRVRSLAAIQEPVVSIHLSLGCPVKFTRQFSALMDPQPQGAVASAVADRGEPELKAYSPALRAALAAPDAKIRDLLDDTQTLSREGAASAPESAASHPSKARQRKSKASVHGSARADSQDQGVALSAQEGASQPAKAKRGKAAPAPAGMSDSLSPPARKGPRLQMEAVDAPQLAAAASAVAFDELRLLKLEQNLGDLQRMQGETRAQIQALRLKQEQAAAEAPTPNWAMSALAALCLALAGSSAFFWRRARQAKAAAEQAWWAEGHESGPDDGHQAATPADGASALAAQSQSGDVFVRTTGSTAMAQGAGSASPDVSAVSESHKASTLPRGDATWSAAAPEPTLDLPPLSMSPVSMPATLPMAHDEALPPSHQEPLSYHWVPEAAPAVETAPALLESAPSQALSVEELIDLEQQVDFFQVLGQDDAAIELLNWQLEGGAGSNALPYLKLLEIHQKRGDEASFQQIAARFSSRFGVPTPDWARDVNEGEGLAARPEILSMIQATWPKGADSMALLQDLLTHGDPASMGFDLTSYRELLMLYGVARDLSEQEPQGEQIDVFLPLDGRSDAASASMMATMLWDGPKPQAPSTLEVDISLDDLAAPGPQGKP